MEFPERYRAPELKNLASKVDVAWGACSGGGTPGAFDCTNGSAPSAGAGACEWGDSAASCTTGLSG